MPILRRIHLRHARVRRRKCGSSAIARSNNSLARRRSASVGLSQVPKAALICFPCAKTLGRLAKDTPLLGVSDGRMDRCRHSRRDLILHREYIFEPRS